MYQHTGFDRQTTPHASGSPSAASAAPGTGAPSAAAAMIRGPEVRRAVTAVLGLASAPTMTSVWSDRLFTCTYHLPTGRLVLSVMEPSDTAAADDYFAALRRRSGFTHSLTYARGHGNPGFESSGGAVVILTHGKVLRVDATAMPQVSGPNMIARADLAYRIAAGVLGRWSG